MGKAISIWETGEGGELPECCALFLAHIEQAIFSVPCLGLGRNVMFTGKNSFFVFGF